MIGNTIITPTLAMAMRRSLREAFNETAERFEPRRLALLYRQEGETVLTVECDRGFAGKPPVDGPEMNWALVHGCFGEGNQIQEQSGERHLLCLPIKRPPDGPVVGVLYFETDRKIPEDEMFSIESLAGRAGADLAMARKRLLSDARRVLPTSDLVENWTGIRRAGLEAFGAGVKDMALSFLERAKNLAEEWGPCKELAQSLNDYGQVLRANDRMDDAMEQFQRGMSILEQAGMDRHPQAIPLLNNLGGVHHAQGDLKEAERLYQLGLDIMTEQPKENKATPAVMSNLGVISLEKGDPATARVWFEQAVASATRLFGEDHAHTEKCREKLASL
jgi:tetratricopeptide (TPR) repeat protein